MQRYILIFVHLIAFSLILTVVAGGLIRLIDYLPKTIVSFILSFFTKTILSTFFYTSKIYEICENCMFSHIPYNYNQVQLKIKMLGLKVIRRSYPKPITQFNPGNMIEKILLREVIKAPYKIISTVLRYGTWAIELRSAVFL